MLLLKTLHPNRWFLYFIAIAFLILLGVYYAAQTFLIEEDTRILEQPIGVLDTPPAHTAGDSVDTSGWRTYRNEEYGFSFSMPISWGEYIIEERSFDRMVQLLIYWHTSQESYPTDKPGYADIVTIYIQPLEDWIIEGGDGPSPIYIGGNSKFGFGYGLSQDSPNDLMKQHEEFKNLKFTFFEPKK